MQGSRFAQFDAMIGSASKSVQKLKGRYMDKYQLSAAHTDCLCRMMEHPDGLTQQELTALEDMDKAQVSRVLNTLLKRGLVVSDGVRSYKKRYRLTEEGRAVTAEIQQIILNINQYVSSDFSDEEIAAFYSIFSRINEHLKSAVAMSGTGAAPFAPEE